MIVKLTDIIPKVEAVIKNPEKHGYKLPMYEDLYSFQLGRTTYFAGIPSHGKSTFLFETLIQLSEKYGLKHVIFAPEEGTTEEVYTTLLSMITRKKNKTGAYNKLTNVDLYNESAFINEHFNVVESNEKAFSPYELLDGIKDFIKQNFISTIMIDPWNELRHNFSEHGGRQDVYLERVLGDIRLFSRNNNVHTFIVAHPRTLQKLKDSDKYEPPTAFEFSGGATWYAKADGIVCVYRPNEFSEIVSQQTQVDIIIQKAKRGIGKKGIIKMDFDIDSQRYKYNNENIDIVRDITPF
jgi:twinkle protein